MLWLQMIFKNKPQCTIMSTARRPAFHAKVFGIDCRGRSEAVRGELERGCQGEARYYLKTYLVKLDYCCIEKNNITQCSQEVYV